MMQGVLHAYSQIWAITQQLLQRWLLLGHELGLEEGLGSQHAPQVYAQDPDIAVGALDACRACHGERQVQQGGRCGWPVWQAHGDERVCERGLLIPR